LKRREVLVAAATAGWSLPLGAQPRAMRRVAILLASTENDPDAQRRAADIRNGLKALGWNEGSNIRFDVKFGAGDAQRMRDYSTGFAADPPDAIVVNSSPALDSALKATKTIPIVFVLAVDPVTLGHIESVAHPGGNVTGFTFWDASLIGKWLQLLKEAVPSLERATLLYNPDTTPFYPRIVEQARRLPNLPSVTLATAEVSARADIGRALGELGRTPGNSLILPSDPFLSSHRTEMAAAALAARLPSIAIFRSFAQAGYLMSYGPDISEIFKRSAVYIDRILKGAKPRDLPAQEPTRYEFTVNMATARKLGLTIPPSLLARADEVIE
jgi:putative ABC transport system substrate-binding protein